MGGTVDYGGITFDADFLGARVADCDVAFTRTERALLMAFTSRPGRAFSRAELLDAVSGAGSAARDRTIDFAINRLRRKLGDNPQDPQFIATRYGEGYVWIAQPAAAPAPSTAFIRVGPIYGVSGASATHAKTFASALARRLDEMTDPARIVIFDADAFHAGPDAPQFVVSLSFLELADGRLDCSVALRRGADGHVLKVFRRPLPAEPDHLQVADDAAAIIDAVWRSFASPAVATASPTDVPLPIRLQEASEQMGAPYERGWRDAEIRLREALARDPDDAFSRLMLATVIHSKYIISGAEVLAVSDPRRSDEAEIEALVTAALPRVEGNDIAVLGAAKLLAFVSPIYADFALQLAERAFAGTTAFAAAFATLGQLRMHRGDIGEAVRLFRLGSELARPESYFGSYLKVLLCEALLAAGDTKALSLAVEPLFVTEALRRYFAFLYPPPPRMDVGYDIEAVLERLPLPAARAMLLTRHYVSARLFSDPGHRRNIMGHVGGILARRYGPDVVPDEVAPDLPASLLPAERTWLRS